MRDVLAALQPPGLLVLGCFEPVPADGVPAMPDGRVTRTVVLVGNAGPAFWQAFAAAARGGPAPLDAWTRERLGPVAAGLGAAALYPFQGPPYPPVQRWALRSGAVFASPLGLTIHPVYGLWHAYRAALLFAGPVAGALAEPTGVNPCESCAGRPCLAACPVGAFSGTGYDVPGCLDHLATKAGADCVGGGCLARRACPVGCEYRYAPAQAAFHMAAFRTMAGAL